MITCTEYLNIMWTLCGKYGHVCVERQLTLEQEVLFNIEQIYIKTYWVVKSTTMLDSALACLPMGFNDGDETKSV